MLAELLRIYKLIEFATSQGANLLTVESLVKQLTVEVEGALHDIGHNPAAVLDAVEGKPNVVTEDVNAIVPPAADLVAEIDKIWVNLNNVLRSLGLEKK
jgi:hypothetical protein